MPMPIEWTAAMDHRLLHLVQAGQSWDAVSAAMRVGRSSVIERARRLGVAAHEKPVVGLARQDDGMARNDREVLEAGHPISWGAISALTPSIDACWPYRS